MRLKLCLLLVASTAYGQGRVYSRPCERVSLRSSRGGVACEGYTPAFFEFLSAGTSAGSPAASCDGTTPTGVGGETLTFTRNSVAYCDKSNGTTGILPGDLVEVGVNVPRVSKRGGSQYALGVFGARTNKHLRSNEPNTTWTKEAGVTAANASASCPVAPDGTQTMGLITYGGSGPSGIYQAVTVTSNAAIVHSVYVARKAGGAACVLTLTDAYTGGMVTGTVITVPASGYTRGVFQQTITGATAGIYLAEAVTGDCTDVCVWALMLEEGTGVSPPIITAGTAETRAAEVASFSVALDGAARSLSANVTPPSTFTAGRTALHIYFDANNSTKLYTTSTASTSTVTSNFRIGGADALKATTATMTASTAARLGAYYASSVQGTCLDGTCVTQAGALTLPTGTATVYIGGAQSGAGTEINGWSGQVKIDKSAAGGL